MRCLPGALGDVCRREWAPAEGDVTVPPQTPQLMLQNFFWSIDLKTRRDQKHLVLGENAEVIGVLLAVLLYF